MQKTAKRMSRTRLTFICVWLAIFAGSYLVWALYLGAVNRSLTKYEEYSPERVAAQVFDEYFLSADAAKIATYSELELSPLEGENAAERVISRIIEGKELDCAADGESLRYSVSAGGVEFAEFTLKEDPSSKEIFGRHAHELDAVALKLSPDYSATIRAPKGARVTVNGITLTENERIGDYETLADAAYFPENDPDARLMATYRIEGLYAPPEIGVEGADGTVYGLQTDLAAGEYDSEYSYRSALSEKYNKTIFG